MAQVALATVEAVEKALGRMGEEMAAVTMEVVATVTAATEMVAVATEMVAASMVEGLPARTMWMARRAGDARSAPQPQSLPRPWQLRRRAVGTPIISWKGVAGSGRPRDLPSVALHLLLAF